MFKLFRKYNKWLLPVAGCILMVMFVMEGALTSLFGGGGPGNEVLGSTPAGRVRTSDVYVSSAQRHIIQSLNLPLFIPQTEDAELAWHLMQLDAQRMGLNAGSADLAQLYQELQLSDANERVRRATMMGTDLAGLEAAAREYLIHVKYVNLLFGKTRLSEPAMRRLMYETGTRISIRAARIDIDRYLDQIDPPTEDQLQALFEQYRGDLPGTSEPFGIGYKFPHRIKIEYLRFPYRELMAKVRSDRMVREIDAIDYYDRHKDEFQRNGEQQPYDGAVREQIFNMLRDDKVFELSTQMYRDAQDLLYQGYRTIEQVRGYRELPADWQPMPLSEVAEQIQQRHGVMPEVQRYDERWRDADELTAISHFAGAQLDGTTPVPVVPYLFSAREFEPDPTDPLASLRLQVGLPSQPVRARDGSLMLIRLIEASAEHEPASLDEVRQQVEADALQLAAYQRLIEDRDLWQQRLDASDVATLAAEHGLSLLTPPPFTRREMRQNPFGQMAGIQAPLLPGIGRNEAFIDAVATLADDYSPTSAAKPQAVIEVEAQMSLFLVSIIDVEPMRRREYDMMVAMGAAEYLADQVLLGDGDVNPLSFESIAARVSFTRQTPENDDDI